MKLICVGGTWSSCGKTSMVEMLLRAFPGWAAIKVTPSRPDEVCPIGTCCGACAEPEGPYEVIIDPAILRDPGKDTARFLEAGASKVAWLRALPERLSEALQVALDGFGDVPGVIIESTTLIPHVSGLRIVVSPEGVWKLKDSVLNTAGSVDVLAVNHQAVEASDKPAATAGDAMADGVSRELRPGRSFEVCAVRPPDVHPNAEFIGYCREAVRKLA